MNPYFVTGSFIVLAGIGAIFAFSGVAPNEDVRGAGYILFFVFLILTIVAWIIYYNQYKKTLNK